MVHSVAEQLGGRAPLLGGVGRSIAMPARWPRRRRLPA